MINKVLRKIGIRLLRRQGYSSYAACQTYDMFWRDLFDRSPVTFRQRLWAYRRGFLASTIVNAGVTPDNQSDFLPDRCYYKLHPVNNRCSKWIDDKLTMRLALAPFADYLPKYYFDLRGGSIHRLMDGSAEYSADLAGILRLLVREKRLALKQVMGAGGVGFYKLEADHGAFLVNETRMTGEELTAFLSTLSGYVVTEYLYPHPALRTIFPNTINSVRLSVLHEAGCEPAFVGAFAKFGTARSGAVDNVVAGGVFCGVRIEDGTLFRSGRYEHSLFVPMPVHPDTGVPIQGTLPYWDAIKRKTLDICNYLPQVEWIGFDIVITEEGFKFLELNSHQSSDILQQHHPLLRAPATRRYFHRALAAKGIRLARN